MATAGVNALLSSFGYNAATAHTGHAVSVMKGFGENGFVGLLTVAGGIVATTFASMMVQAAANSNQAKNALSCLPSFVDSDSAGQDQDTEYSYASGFLPRPVAAYT